MLKIPYEMEQITLDAKSIADLELVNPRNIHQSQVKSIYHSLCKGEHFDTNFVANRIGSKTRIIDGNHRISALQLFFKKYPSEQIQVYFSIYKDLNEAQERQIFTRWNMGIRQSVDDFIHNYKDTIPMFHRLTKELPCSIYGSPYKMKLRHITDAYFTSLDFPYKGWKKYTRFDIIRLIQELKDDEVNTIIKNFNIIQKTFNAKNIKDIHNLPAFTNIIYRAIYYIIANTVDTLGEDVIVKKMQKNLLDRAIMTQYKGFHGRQAAMAAFIAFKQTLDIEIKEKTTKAPAKQKKIKVIKDYCLPHEEPDGEKSKKKTSDITEDIRKRLVIERKNEA